MNTFYHEAVHVVQDVMQKLLETRGNDGEKKDVTFYKSIAGVSSDSEAIAFVSNMRRKFESRGDYFVSAYVSSRFCAEYEAYYLAAHFAKNKGYRASETYVVEIEDAILKSDDSKLVEYLSYQVGNNYIGESLAPIDTRSMRNHCDAYGFGAPVEVFRFAVDQDFLLATFVKGG